MKCFLPQLYFYLPKSIFLKRSLPTSIPVLMSVHLTSLAFIVPLREFTKSKIMLITGARF